MTTTAASCKDRYCGSCPTWKSMTTVNRQILNMPHRLNGHVDRFAPAYWVIASRSFLLMAGKAIRRGVRRSSELFYRFKTGEAALTFPLALGMHRALEKARRLDFDVIVPVPLSPDKAKRGELHRTLALSKELGRLMSVRMEPWLSLTKPISKHKLRTGMGYGVSAFEEAYAAALSTDARLAQEVGSVLLVDDVCTEGSTLGVCAEAMRELNPDLRVVAATAGQMTVKNAVNDAKTLWE